MAKRISKEELLRRCQETQRKLEAATAWLSIVLQERMRDGVSGRVVIEILTEDGYAKKVRMTQESHLDDKTGGEDD